MELSKLKFVYPKTLSKKLKKKQSINYLKISIMHVSRKQVKYLKNKNTPVVRVNDKSQFSQKELVRIDMAGQRAHAQTCNLINCQRKRKPASELAEALNSFREKVTSVPMGL